MDDWTLKRDDDGYWYWERGNEQSPIFCVKALAMKWRQARRVGDK